MVQPSFCAASALSSASRFMKVDKPSSKCSIGVFSGTLAVLDDTVCPLARGSCVGTEDST